MNYLLLTCSVFTNVAVSICRSQFSKKQINGQSDMQLFNMVNSTLSVITLAIIALFMGGLALPSAYTLVLGIAYGVVTALGAIFMIMALETGPLSYTTVIISCQMVIPSLSGLSFGETVSIYQYIGIGVMVLSFLLAVDTKNGEENGTSIEWLIYCLLAFLCCGSVGVLQKIHQNSPHKGELSIFLIIAFAISAVYSLAMMIYYHKVKKMPITVLRKGKIRSLIWIGLVIGVGFAFCNQINMYLSGVMDSIIFFPVVNGGSMILTTGVGLVFFKEKLSRKQMIGLGLGVVAMFLLCNIIR